MDRNFLDVRTAAILTAFDVVGSMVKTSYTALLIASAGFVIQNAAHEFFRNDLVPFWKSDVSPVINAVVSASDAILSISSSVKFAEGRAAEYAEKAKQFDIEKNVISILNKNNGE